MQHLRFYDVYMNIITRDQTVRGISVDKNLIFAAGIILTLACVYIAYRFMKKYESGDYRRALWLKSAAALCFVVLGLVNSVVGIDPDYARRVCIGLALGLIGDALLAMRFLYPDRSDQFFSAGALSFAFGHLMYIRALIQFAGMTLICSLLLFALGYAAAMFYGRHRKVDAGHLNICAAAYIALVVLMASVACGVAARTFSMGTLMFAVAGICFSVSDCILCAYCYGDKKTKGMNAAVHVTYYAAQLLIAWSIALV